MTAKEYLSQAYQIDKEIKMKYEQLQKLYAVRVLQTTTPANPRTCHELDAAFVVLEQQYATEIKQLLQLKRKIQLIINSLDNSTHLIILTEKYINLKHPDDIAAEIPCDVRTVYRWLNEAINTLQAQHSGMFGSSY